MKHNNPSIAEDSLRIFNFKSGEGLGEIHDQIIPNIPVHPRINIVRHANGTDVTSQLIYTTPTDKDFYLQSLHLAVSSSATATNTILCIKAYVDGLQKQLICILKNTLTATSGVSTGLVFPIPIKIDRGTNIDLTSDTNNTLFKMTGCITGYTEETVKGV